MGERTDSMTRRERLLESLRPWYDVWWSAVAHPGKATYDDLAHEGRIERRRPYIWVVAASALSGLISMVMRQAVANFNGTPVTGGALSIQRLGLGLFLLETVFFVLLSAVVLSLITLALAGLTHVLANVLGGRGTYGVYLFVYAAGYLPLLLLNSFLEPVPTVIYLTFLTGTYGAILNVYAIRAAYGLGTGRALLVAVVVAVLLLGGGSLLAAGLAG